MPPVSTSDSSHDDRLLLVIGGVSGACVALATLASASGTEGASWLMVLIQATVAAQGGAALLWVVRASLRWAVGRASGSHATRDAYMRDDTATYAVFLVTLATALGVQLVAPVLWMLLVLFVAAQWRVLRRARATRTLADARHPSAAALAAAGLTGLTVTLYAVAWGRMLERTWGTTAGTSALLLVSLLGGLGLGTMAAGRATRAPSASPLVLVAALQLVAAGWGVASAWLVPGIATLATAASPIAAAVATVAAIAAPMFLAGATLPLLGASAEPPSATGPGMALYATAALGAAGACFLAADVLFAFVGVRSVVWVAAACNMLAALAVPTAAVLRRRATLVERA